MKHMNYVWSKLISIRHELRFSHCEEDWIMINENCYFSTFTISSEYVWTLTIRTSVFRRKISMQFKFQKNKGTRSDFTRCPYTCIWSILCHKIWQFSGKPKFSREYQTARITSRCSHMDWLCWKTNIAYYNSVFGCWWWLRDLQPDHAHNSFR